MGITDWLRPPRQVLTIFLVMAGASAAALGGLTWQLLRQDRDLAVKRQADQLQQTADRTAVAMRRALDTLRTEIARPVDDSSSAEGTLVRDVLAVSISGDEIVARPPGRLLYYPASAAGQPAAPPAIFDDAERLEHRARDLAGAARAYSRLAQSTSVDVRAEALLRLARVERARDADAQALAAYDDLFALTSASAGDLPAPLAARLGRITVHKGNGRALELQEEAANLLLDLRQGRWRISREKYGAYVAEARSFLPDARLDDSDAITRAEAVDWLWKNREISGAEGERAVVLATGTALVLWSKSSSHLNAVVAGPTAIEALCRDLVPADAHWSLTDPDGRSILGEPPPPGTVVSAPAAGIDLPWTLQVYGVDGQALPASPQRPLLLLVLGLVTLVFAGGWYATFRSLGRERRVTELQSDFVAAVSHEFRSPLTSLAQMADLLDQDRLATEALRRESYGVLVRETARLRTLVEGLLDFGRFDADASAYHFEKIDPADLVRGIVADFQQRAGRDGYQVELAGTLADTHVRGDREALGRALWNLLDNAVKYSPHCRTVWVEMVHDAGRVYIAVRDRGLGIPAAEQPRIFDRFVRGAESKLRRIRGTGIGLAMVRQIAEAHGGEVTVTSEVGVGSTFTILLAADDGRAPVDVESEAGGTVQAGENHRDAPKERRRAWLGFS